jgi:methionine-R-sulfoxide reductase
MLKSIGAGGRGRSIGGSVMKTRLGLELVSIALLGALLGGRAQAWNASSFKKPTDAQLRKTLTKEQYDVTQKEGTDRPFTGKYVKNHQAGLYVDIVSGEPLFTSNEKFDSGTGWPSFYAPIKKDAVTTRDDTSLLIKRIEVRSKLADSHLGHVFNDGPPPTGLRYCMNSSSLRFIPVSNLEKEGYGEYAKLFEKKPEAKK